MKQNGKLLHILIKRSGYNVLCYSLVYNSKNKEENLRNKDHNESI